MSLSSIRLQNNMTLEPFNGQQICDMSVIASDGNTFWSYIGSETTGFNGIVRFPVNGFSMYA